MNEQDKEAFEKWWSGPDTCAVTKKLYWLQYYKGADVTMVSHRAWEAALSHERNDSSIKVAQAQAFAIQERERSKKLVVHLEILIEVLADDCRSDEDCDHCWAVLALKEYRGEK